MALKSSYAEAMSWHDLDKAFCMTMCFQGCPASMTLTWTLACFQRHSVSMTLTWSFECVARGVQPVWPWSDLVYVFPEAFNLYDLDLTLCVCFQGHSISSTLTWPCVCVSRGIQPLQPWPDFVCEFPGAFSLYDLCLTLCVCFQGRSASTTLTTMATSPSRRWSTLWMLSTVWWATCWTCRKMKTRLRNVSRKYSLKWTRYAMG